MRHGARSTGQLRLETKKQLFVPSADEVIEEVRDLIKLADHEAIIVKNKDGDRGLRSALRREHSKHYRRQKCTRALFTSMRLGTG